MPQQPTSKIVSIIQLKTKKRAKEKIRSIIYKKNISKLKRSLKESRGEMGTKQSAHLICSPQQANVNKIAPITGHGVQDLKQKTKYSLKLHKTRAYLPTTIKLMSFKTELIQNAGFAINVMKQ